MADVVRVEHANGDVSIGVEVEGVYVPLASATKARIAGLQERAATLSERVKAGDDKAAQDAIDALPISATSTSKSEAKAGGSRTRSRKASGTANAAADTTEGNG